MKIRFKWDWAAATASGIVMVLTFIVTIVRALKGQTDWVLYAGIATVAASTLMGLIGGDE